MSTTTDQRAPLPLRVPALCCECGTVREVAFRNASCDETRTLKCATCHRTTVHAPVRPPGWDRHEYLNSKVKVKLTVPQKLDVLRGLDVEVTHVTLTPGRVASIWWYMDDNLFSVEVSTAATEKWLDVVLDEVLVMVTEPHRAKWMITIEDDGAVVPSVTWRVQ